jgi:hypothetical protein
MAKVYAWFQPRRRYPEISRSPTVAAQELPHSTFHSYSVTQTQTLTGSICIRRPVGDRSKKEFEKYTDEAVFMHLLLPEHFMAEAS